jgi:hypothetical protein
MIQVTVPLLACQHLIVGLIELVGSSLDSELHREAIKSDQQQQAVDGNNDGESNVRTSTHRESDRSSTRPGRRREPKK